MSRTDKDRPARVKAFDPTVERIARHTHLQRALPCTIDVMVTGGGWRAYRSHPCYFYLPYGRYSPTKVERRELYFGPERQRERVAMRDLAARYATYGEVDDWDWQDYQHRHATAKGGYWD